MTRYALVINDTVTNVVDSAMPITGWLPCGDAAPGWTGSAFPFTPPEGYGVVPPITVTPKQAKIALFNAGIPEDVVLSVIAQIPDAGDAERARISWVDATEFVEDDPLVLQLCPFLGIDDTARHQLFLDAQAVP